jgi:hypothetical protein
MLPITDVPTLQHYFSNVVKKANHHAQNVNQIIYPLLGFVMSKIDGFQHVRVWGSLQQPGNLMWVVINGYRYAFNYNHTDQVIEMCQGSYRGRVIARIDNSMPISTLQTIFNEL